MKTIMLNSLCRRLTIYDPSNCVKLWLVTPKSKNQRKNSEALRKSQLGFASKGSEQRLLE